MIQGHSHKPEEILARGCDHRTHRAFLFGMSVVVLILCIVHMLYFPSHAHAADNNVFIKQLEVQGLNRISREEFAYLIDINVGNPLQMEKISLGIRRAFKKGLFLDIQVVSQPAGDGVKLIFLVKETPVIKKISFIGIENIRRKEIEGAFIFKEGDNFKEELLERARVKLLQYYQRAGYPEAEIEIVSFEDYRSASVILQVLIDQGSPLIINNILIPEEAEVFIRLLRGDIFDKNKLEKEMEKLREHYKKRNHVNPVVGPYRFIDGTLEIPVIPGPKLEISFKNNRVFNSKTLKKEISFIENEEVTDEALSETVSRIRKRYVEKGYYHAEIAASIEQDEDIIKVEFVIFEGEKIYLRKVSVNSKEVSSETILRVIPFREGSPFNDNLLEKGKDDLKSFYHALGYLQFEILDVKKEFDKTGTNVDISMNVYEGAQTRIESITVKGNSKLSIGRIMRSLQIKEGDPFNTVDIGDARYRVLSTYRSRGYENAEVQLNSSIHDRAAFLTYTIVENKQSVIGKIIIRGNRKTKSPVIEREFSMKEGDPYDQQEITRTRQRLYKLGIFSEVTITMNDRHEEDKVIKDILVTMKEGKAGTVEVGIGYGDYEEFRGSFDISYRNLGGLNRQVGFRTELSSVEERYVLNFVEPWFFNVRNLPLKLFLMNEDIRSVNVETKDVLYRINKFSFIAGFEKELINDLRVGLNYEYSFTDTSDVKPGIVLSKEDVGTLGIGSISPSIFYDNRDNPFDPTSGSIHGIVMKFASQAFLSETEFVKASFQSSWYFPLRKGTVFAFSLKWGAAYSFEKTNELPLIERYFLGGRSTVRGYSNDALGPKGDDGNPTGGNIFALVNSEIRYSLWRELGVVAFIDSGNVWKTIDNIEAILRYTVGGGIRYSTPVGPVRVDYGHKLSRETGESDGEFHFSFGHAF